MARLATDVVLLPDEEMTSMAIEINQQIVREYSDEIVLGRDGRLPHISLAMGCVAQRDIPSIRTILERIATEAPIGELTVTGVQTSTNSRGQTTAVLEVETTAELQAIHERVMEMIEPVFSHEAEGAVFCDDHVTPSTLDWVRNYPQKAAYGQFRPHITLGYGQVEPEFAFPRTFKAARLALCQLGNHATCCKVLAAVDL